MLSKYTSLLSLAMYSHHHIAFRLVKFVLGRLKLSPSWMKTRLDCCNYMQVKVKFKGLLWSSELQHHYKYSLTNSEVCLYDTGAIGLCFID